MSKAKKLSKGKRRLIIVGAELIVLLVIVIFFFLNQTVGKIDFEEALNEIEAGVNQDIEEESLEIMEGYTNIVLFGLDNRSDNNYSSGNSDTMIIASVNNKTKEVKLVSLYRDTLLFVGDGKYNKANYAYQKGGVTQAVQMINSNLDLDITDYVCVDWKALVETIDALDGIDVEITSSERTQINRYLPDVTEMTGYSSSEVTQDGLVHLDGCQAVTYARIRKTAGDDYLRTARQRIVLQKMMEKAQKADLATLTKICTDVFDNIRTDLSLTDILALASAVTEYKLSSTTGFPFKLTAVESEKYKSIVVPVDMEQNVVELHAYLFGEEGYSPSNSVKNISADIMVETGVTGDSSTIDTSIYNETVGATGTEDAKEHNKEQNNENKDGTDSSDPVSP